MSGNLVSLGLLLPDNITGLYKLNALHQVLNSFGGGRVEMGEILRQPSGKLPTPLGSQLSLAEFSCSPASTGHSGQQKAGQRALRTAKALGT